MAPDPSASLDPDPGPPLPTPGPSDGASLPPSPQPTSTPIPWKLSNGQQTGDDTGSPLPLFKLKREAVTVDPSAVHTLTGLTSSDCAACHAAHSADSVDLIQTSPPGSTLCFRCHSGSGSPYDVAAQFAPTATNNPATDSYFRHLVEDESSRSATCASCHNPHDANSSRPTVSSSGWTASGDVRAADGVAVTNGTTGTEPTYTPISRSNGGSLVLEYQLCLACHSGTRTLPTRSASHPSWWALDKGIELNPANNAFHPIEAAGRNQSTQMAASLAGTSPFKAWNYTIGATIRCTSCHGDPSTVSQPADAQQATHASPNRGLLIAPYRDRVLKSADEPYDPSDFALCYLCHTERPFVDPNYDPSAPDTAFSLHGMHVSLNAWTSDAGTSIDTAGAGEGLALCSECHFRTHSTALAYQAGDTSPTARSTGSAGLVDFAPNVTGPRSWTGPNSNGLGSCTLTCHGFAHNGSGTTYETAPGTSFTADRTSGSIGLTGLTVQFTDQTRYISATNAIWLWDFGDGTTSTLQNPLHVYGSAGTFTVSLTVTRLSNADRPSATMTKASYITVVP